VCFRILRSRNVVAGEASVPLTGPILDGKGLDGALDGTRPLHLDGTDVCDMEPAITQFPPRLVREGKGSVPAGGLELWIASTSEEPLKGLVQTLRYVLEYVRTDASVLLRHRLPQFRYLPHLLVLVQPDTKPVREHSLLQQDVVQSPTRSKPPQQFL